MRHFFQSSSRMMDTHDILTYHFKEQCKLLRKINTTMPNARSLHDQPSVRVKANGAIVLNPSHHHSTMCLDWTPAIISKQHHHHHPYPSYEDDNDDVYNDQDNVDGENVSMIEHAFLSAAPRRRPSSQS